MKQPLWQRRRRLQQSSGHDGSGARAGEVLAPDGADGGRADRPGFGAARSSEGDGGGVPDPPAATDPHRQAAYAAWAERMRSHKKAKLAGIVEAQETESDASTGSPASPYWDAAHLYGPPASEQPADPTRMETTELLAVLQVSDGAALSEIQVAFRRLVKQHHPDRWVEAPEEVREEHAARMVLISEAHRELRRRLA